MNTQVERLSLVDLTNLAVEASDTDTLMRGISAEWDGLVPALVA
ncbi:MAG TPA: hypothetical protein VIJ91_11865 [Candidatus Dormibacteraeota bacterium]